MIDNTILETTLIQEKIKTHKLANGLLSSAYFIMFGWILYLIWHMIF